MECFHIALTRITMWLTKLFFTPVSSRISLLGIELELNVTCQNFLLASVSQNTQKILDIFRIKGALFRIFSPKLKYW